jgi:arylformamidase
MIEIDRQGYSQEEFELQFNPRAAVPPPVHTFALWLTQDMVKRLSPIQQPPRCRMQLLISVGEAEPALWIKQSRDYAEVCRKNGMDVEYVEVPGANHFDMALAMGDMNQRLLPGILRQMGL